MEEMGGGVCVGRMVRVAGGSSVASGRGNTGAVAGGTDVDAMAVTGAGANIRFATGRPNTPPTIAITANTRETVNHCQPVTMRARRVR